MHKRRYVLGVALGIVLVGIGVATVGTPQPCYEGKPAKWWFEEFCRPNANSILLDRTGRKLFDRNDREIEDKPMAALRSLGQESVPYLIQVLNQRETSFTRAWRTVHSLLPANIRRVVPPPGDIPHLHWNAAIALTGLGTNALPAIRAFLDLQTAGAGVNGGPWNTDESLICVLRNCKVTSEQLDSFINRMVDQRKHREVLKIVKVLRPSSREVSKALVLILQKGNAGERQEAAAIIANSESYPGIALHALIKALADSEPEVRYAAVRAIENCGTNALSAKSELEKAALDENTMVRTVARRILDGRHGESN
ncbi:MAG: hypothetical protein JWM99_3927 [Verrucomicrobiales bacterium]|nr:hypothetical protein [Verrucomicrobiales bacterium]